MNSLQLYNRYLAISLRGQMQYRANFVLQSFGVLLVTFIEFLGIWALFHRFGNLRGWTLPEVAMLYGMISISFGVADGMARGFDWFANTIKSGDFDRVLLRPRSSALQIAGQEITLRRVGRLVQGLAVLIWAITMLEVHWSVAKVLLLLAAIIGGACLFIGLVIVQATLAFWTTETLEIMNALTYGGEYAAEYPMAIYRRWFRAVFLFAVPLGCANYLPGLAIMGKADPLGIPAGLQWLAPLAGPLSLLMALQLWQLGVRHYRSTGS
jgi:ABC-2 type transport system permease protein